MLVVANDVTQAPNDKQQLEPMLAKTGALPEELGKAETMLVESRCGAVALGWTYPLPPLSSGGASVVRPWLRFHTPLIEPGRRISRTRLSDKLSRLRPRLVILKPGQTDEPKVPVKMRGWIAPALSPPELVLKA